MKYYDVHDIIAEEAEVKVYFKKDTEISKRYSKDGAVPYYLIKFLLENEHCAIISPVEEIKYELLAKASIVDVNTVSPEFFLLLSKIVTDDYICHVFSERIGDFVEFIFSPEFHDDDKIKMDLFERTIYQKARDQYMQFKYFQKIFRKI